MEIAAVGLFGGLEEQIAGAVGFAFGGIGVFGDQLVAGFHADELGVKRPLVLRAPEEPQLADFPAVLFPDFVVVLEGVVVEARPSLQLAVLVGADEHPRAVGDGGNRLAGGFPFLWIVVVFAC